MMRYKSISTSQEQDILSAYGEAVVEAGRDEKLRRGLWGRERDLLPGFSEHYRRLKALPRRMRRAMQREWKRTLAGVALMMALGAGPSVAATINVDTTAPGINTLDGRCSLIEAILNANDNTLRLASLELTCEAGTPALLGATGADTIVLQANTTHTLPGIFAYYEGPTGTPVIRSQITISGNGSTIRRDPALPLTIPFRIFAVGNGGNLTLERTTVSRGKTRFDSNQPGGGVLNRYGTLSVTNSTISRNVASGNQSFGGGVFNTNGTLTLTRTIISGNFHATGLLNFSEVVSSPTITTNGFNLFGHKALTTAQALFGVTPGATDITATSNGTKPTLITSILNITLANNGGPTLTNALVTGSPAIDAVSSGCPIGLKDQRGILRPKDGNGDGIARCDIRAFERQSLTTP